jgi:zinc/manganese transport system substrate-binding protein
VVRLAAAVLVALVLAGSASSSPSGGKIRVVAAENVWGNIAAQVGGDRVDVTSIVTSPSADPHDYEPTAFDARTLAGAKLAIVNGIGYDDWASKLLAANPVHGRVVLDVGRLLGFGRGANPHRWYSPGDVQTVIGELYNDYIRLDPKDTAYFRAQQTAFETRALARYKQLIATIQRRFRGAPVGASESIFAPMAQALGLRLLTPASFMNAVSEGTDPTAAAKQTVDRQIATRAIRVWVYNSQNATPDVKRITEAARKKGIPVVTVTETITPASASFQDWQSRQLAALLAALR